MKRIAQLLAVLMAVLYCSSAFAVVDPYEALEVTPTEGVVESLQHFTITFAGLPVTVNEEAIPTLQKGGGATVEGHMRADEDGTTTVEGIKVQSAVLSTQLDGLVREYRMDTKKRGSLRMGPIDGSKLYASINYSPEETYGRKSDVFTLTAIDSTTWDTYKASWTVNLDKFAGGLYTQKLVMQKQPLQVQTLYQDPVTVYTPENGKYRLGHMGDVAVYNGGAADIEGYTVLNVHLFDARLDGQIKLAGEVSNHMALSSKIFSESSLINNPDGVAIKNAGELPIIIAEGSTLTIKGDIDGDLSLQPGSLVTVEGDIKGMIRLAVGSRMRVKGDVSKAAFFATEGSITDFTEYDPASDYRVKTGFTIYEARYPIGGR